MKHVLPLIVASMLLLPGCGGGGSGTVIASIFAGLWAGTWASTDLGQDGTVSATVAESGNFTGTVHNNDTGGDGSISGKFNNGGTFSGTISFPGEPNSSISGTAVLSGDGNTITGNGQQNIDGTIYSLSFSLTRQ